MRYPLRSILVCVVVLLSAADARNTTAQSLPQRLLDARKPNTTPSQFLQPILDKDAPSSPDATLILFVHGIFGDTIDTWKHENGWSLARRVLSLPEFSKGVDAFAFGYPSAAIRDGSFNIPKAATALLSDVKYFRLLNRYKRVVIVAHSMGGLVALEAILSSRELASRVPILVTYSTPWDGASLAEVASTLLSNPGLGDMRSVDSNNAYLESLRNRWKRAKDEEHLQTTIRCAIETVKLPAVGLVVKQSSGEALCSGVADPIAEDHLGIVKPGTPDHRAVRVLVNALRELPPPIVYGPIGLEIEMRKGGQPLQESAGSRVGEGRDGVVSSVVVHAKGLPPGLVLKREYFYMTDTGTRDAGGPIMSATSTGPGFADDRFDYPKGLRGIRFWLEGAGADKYTVRYSMALTPDGRINEGRNGAQAGDWLSTTSSSQHQLVWLSLSVDKAQ